MIEQRIINSSITELYISGGGNFMTQSKPTNFHVFLTSKVLAAAESIADWMEVTPSQKTALEAADAAWERPPQAFIDMWNDRAHYGVYGQYNEGTGFFELNGITNITYKEALTIMAVDTTPRIHTKEYNQSNYAFIQARTFFPIRGDLSLNISGIGFCCNSVESIRLMSYYYTDNTIKSYEDPSDTSRVINIDDTADFFTDHGSAARGLKKVFGVLQLRNAESNGHFAKSNLNRLEEMWLLSLKSDIPTMLKYNTTFKIVCLQYMVEHAGNSNPITITVSEPVYQKLTGSGDYSDANGTREEWMQLYQDALEKQITFASAN